MHGPKLCINTKYDGNIMLNTNGSPCWVTNIASKLSPKTAQELKEFYLPSVSSLFTTNAPGQCTPGQTIFSIKTAADEEKGSASAQGLAKLNLFKSGAVLDYDTGSASNPSYAIFGTTMKVTLGKPRAAHKAAFGSLVEMTFGVTSKQDCSSIYSSQVSVKVLQVSVASRLLDNVFESNLPADLHHDQNTVGPSALLPQRDDRAINCIRSQNKTQRNAIAMDIIKSQKQVPRSYIEKISVMESVKDFSSLVINTITISTVIVDHKEIEKLGSQGVICQVAHEFTLIVNLAEWAKWVKVTGGG